MRLMIILLCLLMVFAVGCSTELGHSDHDHDGDGVQDHSAEDHVDEHNEEHMDEHDRTIPENCESWYDGCNNCIVEDGEIDGCTRKYCPPEMMKEAKCLKFKE